MAGACGAGRSFCTGVARLCAKTLSLLLHPHKIIEASVALRNEHGLQIDAIKSARVERPHGSKRPLHHPFPCTGLNGKFSAPYAVLVSVIDGRINLASFVDEAVLRPEVQSRLADVEVVEVGAASNEGSDLNNGPVTVSLTGVAAATLASATLFVGLAQLCNGASRLLLRHF